MSPAMFGPRANNTVISADLESRTVPRVSEQEAQRLAREIYRLEARAHALPGEYDDNFTLTADNRQTFVLKIMAAARSWELIDLQRQALLHLERRAPDLELPRVCPAPDGSTITKAYIGGEERFVWLLTYVHGRILAKTNPHSPTLLRGLGSFLGEVSRELQDFQHPGEHRELKWDLMRAAWVRDYLACVEGASNRDLVENVLRLYDEEAVPNFTRLRKSVIHGDANDHNVVVLAGEATKSKGVSIIDFGDMHLGLLAAEVAVAATYALLGKSRPLEAAALVVEGFHREFPLREEEIAILFPLIVARLAVGVVYSAYRKTLVPDDPYVVISEAPAWEALRHLQEIHPRFAQYTFRHACGLPPVPRAPEFRNFLRQISSRAASIVDSDLRSNDLRSRGVREIDLSVGSPLFGAHLLAEYSEKDPRSAAAYVIARELQEPGLHVGRYDEARLFHATQCIGERSPIDEQPTIHLGMDLFVPPDLVVRAPLEGVVHSLVEDAQTLDSRSVLILRHRFDEIGEFFMLYGNLSPASLAELKVGQRIQAGQSLGKPGRFSGEDCWPPHVHFQVITDLLGIEDDFPGVAPASERAIWTSLSPDPNLLLDIPADRTAARPTSVEETLHERKQLLGRNLSVSYQTPLNMVRGERQYLYDETGRAYLDVYNNVPLVGHSHPRVVQAVCDQLGVLNTNTRYLHGNIVRYAQRLTQLMPAPLRVCYFLNSGSEANELALRLARAHTGCNDVIVLEHAYHGHTTTLIDISPYKFNGPGGAGRKPWVHVASAR